MTPRVTGGHDYRDGEHCHYCGTKSSWPLGKQPCPRAKIEINAAAAKQRARAYQAKLKAAKRQLPTE